MFNLFWTKKKEEKLVDNIMERVENTIDNELSRFVTCEDCGVAGLREKFWRVAVDSHHSGLSWFKPKDYYYCPTHRKNYDTIDYNFIPAKKTITETKTVK